MDGAVRVLQARVAPLPSSILPMRLKLYCNRYTHFKDALVCSVNCIYRTRCRDFALFYDEHREAVDALVTDYFSARRAETTPARSLPIAPAVSTAADMRALFSLEVKKVMAEATYIWIDKEGRAELVEMGEILRRAERGAKPQHIYKVAQEMELRFQLVPRKNIDKVKRTVAAEAERTAARRTRTVAAKSPEPPSSAPAPLAPASEPTTGYAPRAKRARAAKAVSER